MNVLVVGSGGREHALAWAIAKSPRCQKLYCAPGNGGISQVADCIDIDAEDLDGLVDFALDKKIEFVVIGPEMPLVLGLADRLTEAGIKAFGPSAKAAMIGRNITTTGVLFMKALVTNTAAKAAMSVMKGRES